MKKISGLIVGFASGLFNALFGSGGGIIAVTYMKKKGLSQKQAQATALTISVILSLFSVLYYYFRGYFNFSEGIVYVPFGTVGAFFGSILLSKLPDRLLKKIFALFIIWAGVKMVW